MADNKKYYYMRLKENFFESEEMVMLEAMPDGLLYSNILIKMYLKSLKANGSLMFKDTIPYNAQMIATVTRHQIGTVEKALQIFEQLNLIEILDNGTIYMSDIELFIGSASTEAERKKQARLLLKAEKNSKIQLESTNSDKRPTNGGQMVSKCPPEFRDKRLELREKEKNSLSVASNEQSKPPSVHDLIFDHYISKGLIRHKALTAAMKAAINARLKDYSYEELVQAIDNYTVVYNSPEHFFKQKYGLADLMRDKDVRKFLNEAEPLQNFLINKRGARAGATYQQGYSNDGQPRNTSNFKSKFGVELDF